MQPPVEGIVSQPTLFCLLKPAIASRTISCRLGGIGSSKQILIAHVVKTDFLPGRQCGGVVLNLIRLIGYRTMLPGVRLSLFGLKPCIQRHTG
ncbi:hypothetical protein ExPUPEC79_02983 [Escherichia coli]|nr:hypothetical protein ExPUPEC79_02983 [Escherichia coli]